jgi:hypothetical protein
MSLFVFSLKGEAQITESQKISDKVDRQIAAREKRVADFLKLSPQERVNFWLKTTDWDYVRDALIVNGQDTVPYLADLIYKGKQEQQKRALQLLCEMDRFVEDEKLVLPEAGGSIYVKPLKISGRANHFMQIDGRRIGKVGVDAVMWLAEQTENDYLRFHARNSTGLLEQDLSKLSLKEQFIKWREVAADSKGVYGLFGNFKEYRAYKIRQILSGLLIEKVPDSLPPLIEILKDENENHYVRNEAIGIIVNTDLRRMRLRTNDIGREAIETVRFVLEGNVSPASRSRKAKKLWTWEEVSPVFFDDYIGLHNGSNWSIVALAFEQFYGEDTVIRQPFGVILGKPIMRQFVAYLTKIDPYFPSWEYLYIGSLSQDEVLHPDFKKKIARYYKYWKQFKVEQNIK